MKVVVGQSEDPQGANAVADVVAQISGEIGRLSPKAGILFCSLDYDHGAVLRGLEEAFPGLALIGCTTDGEMSSSLGFTEDSLCLAVLCSDRVAFGVGQGGGVSTAGTAAGEQAARMAVENLGADAQPRFALILADPISAGTSGVDVGIKNVLGMDFPVFGGVSAAHSKRRTTSQFCNGVVGTDNVVLLLVGGPVEYSFGIKGGHTPLGPKKAVTRYDRNVLYRVGETTAYDYFRSAIGENDLFMNFCLAVYEKGSDDYFVLSAPVSDSQAGTVSLNGNLPRDAEVQIGTADKDVVFSSCAEAIGTARAGLDGAPDCALLFSCAGRKMIAGTRIAEETAIVRRALPGVPFAGFYCYGEFGPPAWRHPFRLHGTTFVCLLLRET